MTIPKVIYQTWKTKDLPDCIKKSIDQIKLINPDYTCVLFDDSDCIKFIEENFDSDVLTAYNRLNIGAAKADLWRYCVLYKNGGVYLDIKSSSRKPLDELIKDFEGTIITRELHKFFFLQWALISSPGSPLLKKCIDSIVNFVLNNKCSDRFSVHGVTGPTLYTLTVLKTLDNPLVWTSEDQIYTDSNNFKYKVIGTDYNDWFIYRVDGALDIYNGKHWRDEEKIKMVFSD